MQMIGHDIRIAVRLIFKKPAFTVLVVLVLSLGIGAGSGILTLADTIFWRPLPFHDPELLVALYRFHPGNRQFNTVSYPDYVDYREGESALSGILAFCRAPAVVSGETAAFQVPAELVSGNYFSLLGIKARLGRVLEDEDNGQAGAHRVAVISDRLWRNFYGADPQVVGKAITLNSRRYEVVGVAPPEFKGVRFDSPPDLWLPLAQQPHFLPGIDLLGIREIPWLLLVGRLERGASLGQAQASLDRLDRQLQGNAAEKKWQLRVLPGRYARFWPTFREPLTRYFRLLLGIAGCVLLAGCASAGNLVLNRALERKHEFAIRQVLGAGRARIAGQISVEVLILTVMGGIGGILAARLTLALLTTFPLPAPVQANPPLDWRAAAFTALAAVLSALAFGIVPILKSSGFDLAGRLKEGLRAGASKNRLALRRVLVVAQVALAMVAVSASGLLVESLRRARAADLGFDGSNILMGSVEVMTSGYGPERGAHFFESLQEKLAAVPAVTSVGFAAQVPVSPVRRIDEAVLRGAARESVRVQVNVISSAYLRALAIPIVSGRGFLRRDGKQAQPAALVDEVLASRLWPDQNPVGERLQLASEQTDRQVVGIVKAVQQSPLGEESQPVVYVPFAQSYGPQMTFFVRTAVDPSKLMPILNSKVRELDKHVPVFGVGTMEAHIEESVSQWRLAAALATVSGLWTILLATLGIYGVISFSVQSRTREMGIRIALGSEPGQLSKRLLREGFLLSLGGIIAGIAAGLPAASLLSSLLYGVESNHPPTLIAVACLLLAAASIASYLPARRIARLDPARALNSE